MFVVKRNNRIESVQIDKINRRIKNLCYGLNMKFINPPLITKKVMNGLCPNLTTIQLDELIAEIIASMTIKHPDYALLAGRICISKLHKETKDKFSDVIQDLFLMNNETNDETISQQQQQQPIIPEEIYKIVMENSERLNKAIIYERDFHYNYFAYKTLDPVYLLKINGKIVERPQQMLMRVSLGIHKSNIDDVIETYNLLSEGWFTHASSTLLNSGTIKPQMSSCFLLTLFEDEIETIYDILKQCAIITELSGSIGLNVHCISQGLVPMLRVFDETVRFANLSGDKRPAAFAIYLEPWHFDIFKFLDLKKNTGSEELHARDLFYALWIPDLFMKRVQNDQLWSLMCPNDCPGLSECWGKEFEILYEKYEKEKRFKKQIKAQDLWFAIINSQIETGTPYMVYKDHCNRKSNQKNLGTIMGSNLCTEIVQYSSSSEIAACNLASISLPKFVDKNLKIFDFQKLKNIVKIITKNLNKVIDENYYPLQQIQLSNIRHRPIGIGVQGLADTFLLLRYPFESIEARKLNLKIFETIYYSALETSCELAQIYGPYESYKGSPISFGILQYDMWKRKPTNLWNWNELKEKISKYGVRNSLLIAMMPTASTAQILGNNESFEPYTSNIYVRKVLTGEFQVVNKHLVNDLIELGLWNDRLKMKIIANHGSVQNIKEIPNNIRKLYKTVWEISQKTILDLAIDRAPFIDQSQSLNIYFDKPTIDKISSMHFYGWINGLKTGMYYLRIKPASHAIQFTVDKSIYNSDFNQTQQEEDDNIHQDQCSLENSFDACLMCSG